MNPFTLADGFIPEAQNWLHAPTDDPLPEAEANPSPLRRLALNRRHAAADGIGSRISPLRALARHRRLLWQP